MDTNISVLHEERARRQHLQAVLTRCAWLPPVGQNRFEREALAEKLSDIAGRHPTSHKNSIGEPGEGDDE